jgi:hypothetical protein
MNPRKAFLVVLFISSLSPCLIAAEDQGLQQPQNAVCIDIFSPFTTVLNQILVPGSLIYIPVAIQYERVLSDHWVLFSMLSLNFGLTEPVSAFVHPAIEVDWHPFHMRLDGFYAGLSLALTYESLFGDAAQAFGRSTLYGVYLSPTVGWQFLLPAHIVINLGVGLLEIGYRFKANIDGTTTTGFVLNFPDSYPLSIAVGYRF